MAEKFPDSYFPLLIDLKRYKPLVIGGGEIAARKTNDLLKFDVPVSIISRDFCDELLSLSEQKKIKLIKKDFEKQDIEGYNLIFCAAGDPQTDRMVYEECSEKGILLNVADVPGFCSFIMPATLKRGILTISVASQGKAPFYVKEIKRKLEKIFPESSSQIIELAAMLREKMIQSGIYYDKNERKEIFYKFFDIDFEKIILEEGFEKAQCTVSDLLKKLD